MVFVICGFCIVWVCVCVSFVMCGFYDIVGVLVKCVLLFTVFLYCFVYVYLFLYVLSVLVYGLLPPGDNTFNNNNNNNNK